MGIDLLACFFSGGVNDKALGSLRSSGFYVKSVQSMTSLGHEVEADGVKSE